MSTVEGGGNIVTDGLALCLDAANTKSYSTGTTWRDLSRSQNNGTLINGPTFNSSNGGSIVFDGINDFVQINSNPTLDITNTITIEALINKTTLNQNGSILSKWTTAGGTINSYLLLLGQDSNNSRYGFYLQQSNGIVRNLLQNTILNQNVWYHIVCVANGTTMNTYNNSVLEPISQTYNGTINITTKDLMLGKLRSEDSIYSYNGRTAFTRLYNRALSQQEVLQNFNATRARFGI
jgi:hypothetical protein